MPSNSKLTPIPCPICATPMEPGKASIDALFGKAGVTGFTSLTFSADAETKHKIVDHADPNPAHYCPACKATLILPIVYRH